MAVLARRREELRLRRMARIGRVVVVGLMTADACDGQRCVVGVDVAIAAQPGRHGVRSRKREGGVVVIEDGICPDGRVMTDVTRRRESRRLMRRIIRASIVLLVTRVAERAVQRVVVIDVAVGAEAWWHRVHPGQLEAGACVIELAIRPLRCVMAGLAGRR